MSENELKTEKLSMSNTKKEMLQAYSTVVKQLSEKEKNILQPQKITGEKQKTETVKKVETLSTETISRNIDSLKYEIGSLLAKLNSSLDSEVQKYEDIQKAISIKEEELKEIYEIEKSALSLAAFIETQNLKRAEFDDEMAAKKESLIKEIESTRFDWKKEKDEFESIEKEQDEFNKKKRAREKEEYEYGFKREKQLSENKLKDDHQKIEKEFNEKMEQLKRELDEREKAVSVSEDKFIDQQKKLDNYQNELSAAVDKAIKDTTDRLNREFSNNEELLLKQFEGEKNVLETKINNFEKNNIEQNKKINELSSRIDEAYQKVQDVAVKAIEGASNLKSLNELQKILAEKGNKPKEL